MRNAEILRKTAETDIRLSLSLDGSGNSDISSGVGFMDHMLTLFAAHGCFDLNLSCRGDTFVDDHHSVEDIGICLGQAFKEAVGTKKGIHRYGSLFLPMDEALILAAADISGRGGFYTDLKIPSPKVGTFDTELVKEFFLAFTRESGVTLHIRQFAGENSHHIIEAAFKAFGRCLKEAVSYDERRPDSIPSTKGTLS